MTTSGDRWEDWEFSPDSRLRFEYRRLVGGTRLLLVEASPWKLLFQRRIDELKDALVEDVASWPGVDAVPHRFGGTEFLVDGREIGHVHDWGLFDAPLVRPLGDAVVASGAAGRHHILPDSGWVTTFVEDEASRDRARAILRLSYCWHAAKYDPPGVDRDRAAIREEVAGLPLPEAVRETFHETLRERTR